MQELQNELMNMKSSDDDSTPPASPNMKRAGSKYSESAGLKGALDPFGNLDQPALKPKVNASQAPLTISNIDRVGVVAANERSAAWQAEQLAMASTAADVPPTAAEVALTAEEIANQKNILEYIKLVVVEGEPKIYQYKFNPPTKEEQNKKVSSLEAKATYDRKVKDCQKMYRLTVVVQPNDRAEVLALINGPLKKKRQEWEGNIPNPNDQSSIGKAYRNMCAAQKAYDEAYNKLIELATEKYSAPADSPSPAKEIK